MADPLPTAFCWSRFGTEAGEAIEVILARKSREITRSGAFYWGIGNSVAPGLRELIELTEYPEVLFSPIKSRPRSIDVVPTAVVRWLSGVALDGSKVELPERVSVTSGVADPTAPGIHYALVCHRAAPLRLEEVGRVTFPELRNLRSGNPLGASQVTAIVTRDSEAAGGPNYPVMLRAELVPPYFVRLDRAEPLGRSDARAA